ncbi:MAG: aminotransferase class I/II-fold pyridoxal phosphate-dependent enzyme, partial [Thermoprotei archaeon]
MAYPEFKLERWQSLRELKAKINLSESGIHPLKIQVNLLPDEIEAGYGDTKGSAKLREAISHTYTHCDAGNILITCGGAEANFTAVNSLIKRGDRVCCMMPNYMQIPGLLSELGAHVDHFWLKGEDFEFDEDEFERALREDTRLIVLTSPNNPTGTVLTRDQLEYIADRAMHVGAYVLCDEVYRGLELGVETPPSIVEVYDKGVATSSLSKVYGLAGLRIGWVAGPREVVERAWAAKDYSSISPPIMSQEYATKILESRRELLDRVRKLW